MSVGDFTFDATLVSTEALHWIRSTVGDKKGDRKHLGDNEIAAHLLRHGLTEDSDPIANNTSIHNAAADCCEAIGASLIRESELVFTEGSASKSMAANGYFRLADRLRREEARGGASVFFANPGRYPTTHVPGVDPEPGLEGA